MYEQKDNNALALFDRPVVFHRILVDWTGSVKAALLLSQLIFWSKGDTAKARAGWIYKTRDEWHAELGLNRTEQENARKALKDRGFIEEKLAGNPAKLYYRVVPSILKKFVQSQLAGNLPTSGEETGQLVGTKPANSYTRTTTQKTMDTAAEAAEPLTLIPPEQMTTKFSEPVRAFADFSRQRGFHIRSRNGEGVHYAKGGQQGGWSRPTLLAWEASYRFLIKHHHPEKIRRLVLRFIKYYDSDYAPEVRTFQSFVDKFDRVVKFVNRERAIRVKRGEEDPEEAPYDDPVPTANIRSKPIPFDQEEHDKLREEVDGPLITSEE